MHQLLPTDLLNGKKCVLNGRNNDGVQACKCIALSFRSMFESLYLSEYQCSNFSSDFQVVRLKLENGKRIVGTLIPGSALNATLKCLQQGSEEAEETIY